MHPPDSFCTYRKWLIWDRPSRLAMLISLIVVFPTPMALRIDQLVFNDIISTLRMAVVNTATEEYDLNLVRACSDISTLQKWRASTDHDNMLNQPRLLDILRILWEETILSTRC